MESYQFTFIVNGLGNVLTKIDDKLSMDGVLFYFNGEHKCGQTIIDAKDLDFI